ncbi:hypothetical protein B0J14DRAFT_656044 [Halenospora varia]|nr:hypothetical protein B0J14DRAFT_656044 [Halenospora varia]
MSLPEQRSEVFAAFVTWFYREEIPHYGRRAYDKHRIQVYYTMLYRLFLFGELTCMDNLHNSGMDRIQDTYDDDDDDLNAVCRASDVQEIWENTKDESVLRTFCVFLFLWYSHTVTRHKSEPFKRKRVKSAFRVSSLLHFYN